MMREPEDRELDRLLAQVKLPEAPLGFEKRVLARLREERERSFLAKVKAWWLEQTMGFQGGLVTAGAVAVLMVGVSGFWQWEEKKETDQIVAALDAFEQFQQDQAKWPELELYTSQ